ncbi:MAG: hypothetical protein KIH08_12695 [Candidatus Freyarchaeota archaeon]|nr:hypothetical protein [Candidatus Jordarchaeia archaeon]
MTERECLELSLESDSTIPRFVIRFDGVPEWARLVNLFAQLLYSQLGERLISVIALPREEDLLYESNVLVVVREEEGVDEKIVKAKWEAEDEVGGDLSINYITCTPEEEVFSTAFKREGFRVK